MPDIFTDSTDFDFERELAHAVKEACLALKTLIQQESEISSAKSIYQSMCDRLDELLCGQEGVDMIVQRLDVAG